MVLGGSSSIARQIEYGAPVDIFISANTLWVDYLIEKNVFDEASSTNIASNRLVVIQNKTLQTGEGFQLNSDHAWLHLLNQGRLAIGNFQSVPVGIYSKQALENLGVWHSVVSSLAPVNNVRQVLALVERGETRLGIVYKTDALQSDKVRMIAEVDASLHQRIVYPLVVVKKSKASADFSAFVKSEQGQAILQRYGFDTL
jgi:molybdate transport system substrate-binding protein